MNPPNNANRNKNIAGAVFGIIVFVAAVFLAQKYLLNQSFDKVLVETAAELNKSCPMVVDEETQLDSATALSPNIFQYNYTLVNYEASELNVDTLRSYMEPNILNTVRTNPDLQIFRDNKTTLAYNYNDMNGVFVLKISVTPEMYKKE